MPRQNDVPIKRAQRDLTILFNYTFDRVLGAGAFGTVVKAYDQNGKGHAVKVYQINVKSDVDVHGGITEAYFGQLFRHPNINRVRDFRMTLESAFLVMDLADGDLYDAILNGLSFSQ